VTKLLTRQTRKTHLKTINKTNKKNTFKNYRKYLNMQHQVLNHAYTKKDSS